MAVSKVIFGNTTVMDITDSTVTASKLKSGETAYGADGTKITGSLVVPDVLDDLSDVVITTPQTAQEIYFDGTNWINYGAKIVLTFDDDFKGQTITLAKGQTTITKTAPLNSNTMNLYVNETGLWTISSTISGDTYETEVNVTTFGTSFDAELSSVPPIPEGATVTPTDDIQTWLACANIWDKSYTTLAEVLADRTTFETLIADSNACDYMARSTTWASSDGEIPVMTSDTTPNDKGVCIGTTESDPPATSWYKAFDNNVSTSASVNALNGIYYIGYKFETPVVINMFEYMAVNGGGSYLLAFTYKIEGSNDESTWTSLYEGSFTQAEHQATQTTPYIATFNNTIAYKCYRLSSTNSNYNYQSRFVVGTLQFYEADITHNQDAMALIGKYDYCSNALLGNATWLQAIANSDYVDSVLNVSTPKMTSDTLPSGQVIKSRQVSSFESYKAFDKSISTFWIPIRSTTSIVGDYIGYKFDSPICIKAVNVQGNRFTEIVIEASNDNSTYSSLKTTNLGGGDSYFDKTIILDENVNSYLYYRIRFTSASSNVDCQIAELNFYGRSTNEVLVPLVPTMTSDTTPSGHASADSVYQSQYSAYKAFDGSGTSQWVCGTVAPARGSGSGWIQYEFPNATVVNCMECLEVENRKVTAYTLKGSNDGTTFTTIVSGESFTKVSFANTTAYKYYRLELTCQNLDTSSQTYLPRLYTLQFYQRTIQTNIIHSCANDTIYYMENGSPVIVATTNSDGDGVLDFSSLEDKVYTLYSTVAKNPSDLTLQFTRRIRITNSQYGGTTERYLVPDTIRTLYWYGYKNNIESMVTGNGWSRSGYTFNVPTYNTNYVDCYGNGNTVISGISSTYKPTVMDRMCTMAQGVTAVNSSYGNIKTEPSKAVDGSSATRQTLYDTNTLKFYFNNNPISDNYFTSYTIANRRCNLYGMWYENTIVTPTFISAVYDTLYIMDGSTKIFIANTDGEGKSLAPMLEAGTYTIYSSVAKDPNNLSNPYSKTVTIDESTQTIALMPEGNILYWWGYENEIEDCTSANGWSSSMYTINPPVHNANNIYANASSNNVASNISKTSTIKNKTVKIIGRQTSGNSIGWMVSLRNSKSLNDNSGVVGYGPSSINATETLTMQPQNNDYYLNAGFIGQNRAGYVYALWYE